MILLVKDVLVQACPSDIQYQSKVWTHLLIQGVYFIFDDFLHCIIQEKTSKLFSQKIVNQI
jgi:hypothetical protein